MTDPCTFFLPTHNQQFVLSTCESYATMIPHDISAENHGKIVMTCEHATNRLPHPWKWSEEDLRICSQHWAVDIGAGQFAIELNEKLKVPLILGNVSRLLIDYNRLLDALTLLRTEGDGIIIQLNQNVSDEERIKRVNSYWLPYHTTLEKMIKEFTKLEMVLSIHSFTPCYEGFTREVEIGVLFDKDEELASQICMCLKKHGYDARLNEPWSSKPVLQKHTSNTHKLAYDYNKKFITLEFRQDLVAQKDWRQKVLGVLISFFEQHALC